MVKIRYFDASQMAPLYYILYANVMYTVDPNFIIHQKVFDDFRRP